MEADSDEFWMKLYRSAKKVLADHHCSRHGWPFLSENSG
jgi:hypothetical protein